MLTSISKTKESRQNIPKKPMKCLNYKKWMEVTFFVAFTNDYSITADTSFSELEILAIRMVCQNVRPFMRQKIRTFVTLLQALCNVSTTTNKGADEVLEELQNVIEKRKGWMYKSSG